MKYGYFQVQTRAKGKLELEYFCKNGEDLGLTLDDSGACSSMDLETAVEGLNLHFVLLPV